MDVAGRGLSAYAWVTLLVESRPLDQRSCYGAVTCVHGRRGVCVMSVEFTPEDHAQAEKNSGGQESEDENGATGCLSSLGSVL